MFEVIFLAGVFTIFIFLGLNMLFAAGSVFAAYIGLLFTHPIITTFFTLIAVFTIFGNIIH